MGAQYLSSTVELAGTDVLDQLLTSLTVLRDNALALEQVHAAEIAAAEARFRISARNLVHYMSVRQHDLRAIQQSLISNGLSSLSNTEENTLASIDAVLRQIARAAKVELEPFSEPPVDFDAGPRLLAENAAELLGPKPKRRMTRIMVTMPSEAAHDPELIRRLVEAGMDVMRINCAHDDAAAWEAMARHLRKAESKTGRTCRIQVDLAGPKLRTGALEPLGQVVKIKPGRDGFGRVVRLLRVRLVKDEGEHIGTAAAIALDPSTFASLREGDTLRLHDARSKRRELKVHIEGDDAVFGEGEQTVYIPGGAAVALIRDGTTIQRGCFGHVEELAQTIELRPNDTLVLTRSSEPGRDAHRGPLGEVLEPARVHCTLASVFDHVHVGERVWFDDGRIGGRVSANDGEQIMVHVTYASIHGSRLGAEKGINFPDAQFTLAALTDKDITDLKAAVRFADIIALSFLRSPEDVALLQSHLHRLGSEHLGIVLKIENREAFEKLPGILLTSMRSAPVGVMVARGDLAVEVGFDRLSEVQEEIIWLCEAAHVPVIWATQMLEGLAKKGVPSRAEVTDAAASCRTECAMLNKGPNIVATVAFLSDILARMETHQKKRRATLRRLAVSEGF